MGLSETLRSFKIATWLGWQIESNWTDPFLFAVYSIVKPLASAGILVVMYSIITGGNFNTPIFPYIYFGNAFYIYVGAVMAGISWAVIDDREHYKTLKYMYIAPIHIPFYWLGRGVARFLTGSVAVLITISFGVLLLHVPLDLAKVDWPLFIISLVIGIIMLSMLGLILASITLLVAHHFLHVLHVNAEKQVRYEEGGKLSAVPLQESRFRNCRCRTHGSFHLPNSAGRLQPGFLSKPDTIELSRSTDPAIAAQSNFCW